jgi:hypothetical protein
MLVHLVVRARQALADAQIVLRGWNRIVVALFAVALGVGGTAAFNAGDSAAALFMRLFGV